MMERPGYRPPVQPGRLRAGDCHRDRPATGGGAARGRQPMDRHSVGDGAVTERGPSGGVTQNIFMRK